MMILDSEITHVHRDRDFGRVEALVTLFVKQRGQPVRPLRIRTHMAPQSEGSLRQRLVADAARLAEHVVRRPGASRTHNVA